MTDTQSCNDNTDCTTFCKNEDGSIAYGTGYCVNNSCACASHDDYVQATSACENVCDQEFQYTPPNEQSFTEEEFQEAMASLTSTVLKNDTPCSTSTIATTYPPEMQCSEGNEFNMIEAGGFEYFSIPTGNQTCQVIEQDPSSVSSTLGCESLAVSAALFAQTKKSIAEILNCTCNMTTLNLELSNFMKVINYGTMNCDLSMNQNIEGGIKIIGELSESQVNEIANLSKNFVDNSMQSILDRESEMGSTPTGDTTLQMKMSQLNEETSVQQMTTSINEIMMNIKFGNTMIFENFGTITGKSCVFDQNILINLVSEAILTKGIETAISTDIFTEIKDIIETNRTLKDKGAGDMMEKGGTDYEDSNKQLGENAGDNTAVIGSLICLGIIGVCCVLASFSFAMSKVKSQGGGGSGGLMSGLLTVFFLIIIVLVVVLILNNQDDDE